MANIRTLAASLGLEAELPVQEHPAHLIETVEEPETQQQESAYETAQVQELAKNSLDFLAALLMPTVFKYLFPPIYQAIWQWLLTYIHKSRDFSQLALGLPRGFAKTALVKIFVVYCILFTSRRFILILCENQAKAINIVADVMDMLSESNVRKVFGDWRVGIETDRQELKKFGFRGRDIIILGATVETIRGITIKNARPDVMIFDDIQSRTVAESQSVSDTLEREMYGTAMKAKSPEGCLYIFVGNMYPTKWSILKKLKTNPNWIKFITGGILADGTSLWEDLHPIEQLKKEFQNDLLSGRPELFYSEVLNDENASVNNAVDISKLPAYPYQETDIPAGKYIIIDPSNDKVKSDAVSIGYFEIHDTHPVLIDLYEGKLSPSETIREAVKLALKYNVGLIVVEANAYQYSLLYWFNFICAQLGIIGITPVEIYSGASSKNSRILGMFRELLSGELYVHPRCTTAVHSQITQFNPLKKDNTDGLLDLLTYANKALEMYQMEILNANILTEQDYLTTTVEDAGLF